MKVLAGIITFNPNILRLQENILNIIKQVDRVVIFDNNSNNKQQIKKMIKGQKMFITIISASANKGVAYGLKIIMEFAKKNGFSWVLTLDQDSVCNNNLVYNYLQYIDDPQIGAITCYIEDRNYIDKQLKNSNVKKEVSVCITSGCFMRVDAYFRTNGYNEKLFIDKVDYDICFSLIEKGFKIIKIPYIGLLHELGNSKPQKFFSYTIIPKNYPAWRRYYMMRNAIYLMKAHPDLYSLRKMLSIEGKDLLVVILFETNKIDKLKCAFKGLYDGLILEG